MKCSLSSTIASLSLFNPCSVLSTFAGEKISSTIFVDVPLYLSHSSHRRLTVTVVSSSQSHRRLLVPSLSPSETSQTQFSHRLLNLFVGNRISLLKMRFISNFAFHFVLRLCIQGLCILKFVPKKWVNIQDNKISLDIGKHGFVIIRCEICKFCF